MPKVDERIQALEAKLKQLKVQQQRKEARARTVARWRTRHQELRHKILVGAVLLAKVEDGDYQGADSRVSRTASCVLYWAPSGATPMKSSARICSTMEVSPEATASAQSRSASAMSFAASGRFGAAAALVRVSTTIRGKIREMVWSCV